MTWFKIDDGLHAHPKVLALFDGPCAGEALGLWTLAGSWCASQLADGRVPPSAVRRLGFGVAAADELVRVGLWDRGEDGVYVFHDWTSYNPSRAEVEARRAKTREKVRAHREKARAASNPVTGGAGNPDPDPPVTPPPTRPDPSRSREEQAGRAHAREEAGSTTGRAERLARSLAKLLDGWAERYRARVGASAPPSHRVQLVRTRAPDQVIEHADATGLDDEEVVRLALEGFWARKDLKRPRAAWLGEKLGLYVLTAQEREREEAAKLRNLAEAREKRRREREHDALAGPMPADVAATAAKLGIRVPAKCAPDPDAEEVGLG